MRSSRDYVLKLYIILHTINFSVATKCGRFNFKEVSDDLGIEPLGEPDEIVISAGQYGIIGSYLTSTGLKPSSLAEVILSLGHECNTSQGFQVSRYNDIAICVYVSTGVRSNIQAFYECKEFGGQMFLMRRKESVAILKPLLVADTRLELNGYNIPGQWATGRIPALPEVLLACFGDGKNVDIENAKPDNTTGHKCVKMRPNDGLCVPFSCSDMIANACQMKEPIR